MRRGEKPGKSKAGARRSVGRKPPKNDASGRRELEKRLAESLEREKATGELLQEKDRALAEALEQQTATSEILRVISSSHTDVQPVFDTIVRNAGRVCDAVDALLSLRQDNELVVSADWGPIGVQLGRRGPLTEGTVNGRTILDARPTHVANLATASEFPEGRELALRWGHRTTLGVPLLRKGEALGALLIRRTEVRPFSDAQIAMLQTFADQAVIAIENVRLFTELQEKNRALTTAHAQVTEALEQQTATSEILRAISGSQTDVQPVFDAIARSAVRLCGALRCHVFRFDGALIHIATDYNLQADAEQYFRHAFPAPLTSEGVLSVAIRERRVAQQSNAQKDLARPARERDRARTLGYQAIIVVPMLRDDTVIGAIGLSRPEPHPFSDQQVELLKTFADQAVIAIENVRLFTELGQRNRDLVETLEQQTATSEILRVISQSQTDVQPVFDTIVDNAIRLFRGWAVAVMRSDGELLHLMAARGGVPGTEEYLRGQSPWPIQGVLPASRAVAHRTVVHIPDSESDPTLNQEMRDLARTRGWRSVLAAPMLRDGHPIGAITVTRVEAGPFSSAEVGLLQTFADQAVIAIENVRLFNETKERLEQQTATTEILRVISSSPTDTRPVFDAIAANAARLCTANDAQVLRVEGEALRLVAAFGAPSMPSVRRLTRGHLVGRAVIDRETIHVRDLTQALAEYPETTAARHGVQSALAVPLLREGVALGVIRISRTEIRPFTDKQIALLKTFADQAVIAIENVRLFTELQASNRELTTALDQQTATSDILGVISRSQTNVQPVFDAIVASAVRLLGAYTGGLTRLAGDQIELAALMSTDAVGDAAVRATYPQSLEGESLPAQVIRDRAPLNIADAQTDPRVPEATRALAPVRGFRSLVWVPLLRHDEAVGTISVTRRDPGGFTDDEIALLKTFADQAVIAIENVRLFTELEARNGDLTESLEQQTATSEILRVISQSQTDVQPVFDTIVRSAVRLCDGLFSALYQFDGELLYRVAQHNYAPEALEASDRVFPTRPTRSLGAGRAILERAVIHMPDVEVDPEHQYQALSRAIGTRSSLWVPMLREGAPIGVITVGRAGPGPFSDNEIELLKTFADQAVIAVENVRLFKELEARTGELTRSVEQLTALGEISQAVSSTLDVETVLQTIVSRATQLAGADGCAIYEYDDATEAFHIRATHNLDPVLVETLRAAPLRKGEGAMGRAAETREPTQVADIAAPGAYQSHIRATLLGAGYRALLSVPLLREGEIIGSLSLNRHTPGEFPPEAVEVLKTFATQSALAIQNARLFREIADKSRQLEAASRHKSEFLANMSHELRTPLNAIIGFSEVLTERMFGELNDKQAEYLKDIHASGQHLLSLINDILDLSKIEAGRMELELADFDLPSAIDNALVLVRERTSRRGITLGHSVDEGLGPIRGDERKVKQVLLNLLSNALKFTPEGGRIDVSARVHDDVAEIAVADTGVGIAPEDQEAVFEEFRQVGTADKKVEGTGLGLALSRKFIELHGGQIWVTSELGAGSTFTFTLPLRR